MSKVQKYWKAIAAAVALLGFLFGEFALNSALEAQPPLTWEAIGFLAVFGVIAIPFVLGIQIAIKNFKEAHNGWCFFTFNAVYMVSAGLSATAISMSRNEFGPASVLFIAIGIGTGFGLLLMKNMCLKAVEN